LPVGKKIDIGEYLNVPFTIHNQNDVSQIFLLEIAKSSTMKRKLLQGYDDLFDLDWIQLEKTKVEINAKTSEKIKIYANIPYDKKYCNQHWEATLNIKTEQTSGQLFGLEFSVQLLVETESEKLSNEKKPHGSFSLIPTVIKFEKVKLGQNLTGTVKLYNNEKATHTYIVTIISPSDKVIEQFIPRTVGYKKLPNTKWITISIPGAKNIKRKKNGQKLEPIKEITINSENSILGMLKVKIPKSKKNRNQNWEALLFVRQIDTGKVNFNRVQIQTK